MSNTSNPLGNMSIDYWYKALMVVGVVIFIVNGTELLSRYPTAPIAFLSAGMFFIGLGEWINHFTKSDLHVSGRFVRERHVRVPRALGRIFDMIGIACICMGVYKFF